MGRTASPHRAQQAKPLGNTHSGHTTTSTHKAHSPTPHASPQASPHPSSGPCNRSPGLSPLLHCPAQDLHFLKILTRPPADGLLHIPQGCHPRTLAPKDARPNTLPSTLTEFTLPQLCSNTSSDLGLTSCNTLPCPCLAALHKSHHFILLYVHVCLPTLQGGRKKPPSHSGREAALP